MARKIIVVEDDELSMRLFNDLLLANGYEVLQSVDGSDILQLAREHNPDLIVMDIQLPDVSGIDRTRMLKSDKDLKHIPVLAVTAFSLTGGIERILAAGCDDVLGKPVSVQTFIDAVKRLLP